MQQELDTSAGKIHANHTFIFLDFLVLTHNKSDQWLDCKLHQTTEQEKNKFNITQHI